VLGRCDVIAFVGVQDAARARAFYETTLGLSLVADEPSALVFDANGTVLRVSKVAKVTPAPYTVLGWKVADIRRTIEELAGRGVVFERFGFFPQDALGVWTAPDGTRVAWFKDPDGNVLSLTQFP
jgi:catechol 2,3-dioxygenase-like lactoylglutathione lyase family enzyme